ncbi:MAG: hypothetical protein JOZ18_05045 [Chloroflexi bacterium]|nr:hypothetical protein [Chloroflexota bacterium]
MSRPISSGSLVTIETSSQSVPSIPSWFGEVTMIAHYLEHLGVLSDVSERVRFAQRRFGQYDLIDFAAVPPSLCGEWRTHAGGIL